MSDEHTTETGDRDYDVTLHPFFASSCVLTRKDGEERVLYRQKEKLHLKDKKHPKKHTLKLKGKGNSRDITITIDDPNHSIHSLRLELYDEGRDPTKKQDPYTGGDVLMVHNLADTCPPYCEG